MTRAPHAPGPDPAPAGSVPGLDRDELVRYARHLSLREVGPGGQARLKQARVLVVGTGGLGSPAALYLAAAGVGTVGLVDDDVVDATNLQRQIAHATSTLGAPKVDSAAARLRDLNPHVEVIPHRVRLTSHNASAVFGEYDLVLDGSDNFPTRYLVNDAAVLNGIPVVYGAILRWEGQVSLFGAPAGPCYRCLFREPPPAGLVPSCAEAGVIGALAGVVGAMQALEAVKFLLDAGTSLAGRLLLFDGLAMSWREVALRRDPACPLCGDTPTITGLIDYERFCGVAPAVENHAGILPGADAPPDWASGRITPRSLSRALASDGPPLIVDVRESWEWSLGSLTAQGAIHIPLGELPGRIAELPTARPIVVVCSVGARSAGAVAHLRDHGFDRAVNLEGGLRAWAAEVDPSFTVA